MKCFLALFVIVGALVSTGCTGVAEIKAAKDEKGLKQTKEQMEEVERVMKMSGDAELKNKMGVGGTTAPPSP